MGNPGPEHELMSTLVQEYPRLAETAGMRLPEHDKPMAAPNSHQMRRGRPLETDGTVRLLLRGKPVWFLQVEVQGRFGLDKYATLRAYHGSEVRKNKVGGHTLVLSFDHAETRKFREADEQYREEFAYRGGYLCGADLPQVPLSGGGDMMFERRAAVAALTPFERTDPARASSVLAEMFGKNLAIANLYVEAMMKRSPDVTMLGEVLRPEMMDQLRQLPVFQKLEAQVTASAKARAEQAEADAAQARARTEQAEADIAQAKARTEQAEARAARAEVKAEADGLVRYFAVQGDTPSEYALGRIRGCDDTVLLTSWATRAYRGEKSADIFPEP